MREVDMKVRFDIQNISKRNRFMYLGSIILESGDFDDDITHCRSGGFPMERCVIKT